MATSFSNPAAATFGVERLRQDFPILSQQIHGKPLIYLDNAATTQKPASVIKALVDYYSQDNANIHRGVHSLSERATAAHEAARDKVKGFLNAASSREIIFVRGATEAINLVAQSFVRPRIRPMDEILITEMEHHANIVPWQMVREQTGCVLKVVPINDRGEMIWEDYDRLLGSRTVLVAVNHVSNALGTINPVERIVHLAKNRGVPVLLDGAQAVSHMTVDVQALGCDFYVFSGHKLFGPTGIGVLYGKERWLEAMPPYQGGGDMIKAVRFDRTTYNGLPYKFEAGTPHIAGAIGLGAAIDYVQEIGLANIQAYEAELLDYAQRRLAELEGLRMIGTAEQKAGVASFVMKGIHPHDLGTILDHDGIAIRAGHHCAMPVMDHFNVPATARASFAFYNTVAEVDALVDALQRARRMFL